MVNKPHCYATVVIFLTCCISVQVCVDNLKCKRVRSIYGTMLKGHVFQEHNAANILAYSLLCNSYIRCQSINYVMSRHLCELNSKTKEARPEDYVQDADRVYLTRPSERGIHRIDVGVISDLRTHLRPNWVMKTKPEYRTLRSCCVLRVWSQRWLCYERDQKRVIYII